jgi:cyanophycinase-like exopeptidase
MGGADVDAAFRWLAERADGGEVIVLRASGGGAYNRYITGLAPVDSVETIVLRHRAGASHPAVLRAIAGAEAVFVAGGDQAVSLEF